MQVFQALTPEASSSFPSCGKPQCLLSNPGTPLASPYWVQASCLWAEACRTPVCTMFVTQSALCLSAEFCKIDKIWLQPMIELPRWVRLSFQTVVSVLHKYNQFSKCVSLGRCKSTEFNPNGQLFFTSLVQAMRMIVHFGETLPEQITPEHIISTGLLFVWALCIFCGMLFCFGIGAATGPPSSFIPC